MRYEFDKTSIRDYAYDEFKDMDFSATLSLLSVSLYPLCSCCCMRLTHSTPQLFWFWARYRIFFGLCTSQSHRDIDFPLAFLEYSAGEALEHA